MGKRRMVPAIRTSALMPRKPIVTLATNCSKSFVFLVVLTLGTSIPYFCVFFKSKE
jgi:hypothetical protein